MILDGATGSELIDVVGTRPELDEQLWGATAILDAPAQVQALHRRYVDVGCGHRHDRHLGPRDRRARRPWGQAAACG